MSYLTAAKESAADTLVKTKLAAAGITDVIVRSRKAHLNVPAWKTTVLTVVEGVGEQPGDRAVAVSVLVALSGGTAEVEYFDRDKVHFYWNGEV